MNLYIFPARHCWTEYCLKNEVFVTETSEMKCVCTTCTKTYTSLAISGLF